MSTPREFSESLRNARSHRRLRRWIGIGVVALLAVTALVLGWLFLLSTTFAAREIVVEGTTLLPADQVQQTASVPTDVPLARLDTTGIRERVEQLPEVRSADVSVQYPDTVHIQVTERVAVYQLASGGTFSWLDAEGIAFRTQQPRSSQLPVAELGEDTQRIRADAGTVVTHVPESVRDQVTTIKVKSVDHIEVTLRDHRVIVWGSADDSELKSDVLQTLLGVKAKHYDVSAPNHPTTK